MGVALAWIATFGGYEARAIAASSVVSADDCIAERPQYVPGDNWIYSRRGQRYELSFLRYERNEMVERRTTSSNTRILHSSLDGNPIRLTTEEGRVMEDYGGEIARLRFPLRAGAFWAGGYKTSAGALRDVSARVIGCESITVAAGTFFTFRIEIINRRVGRVRPAYETLWYAPRAKRMVKHVSVELLIDTELTQYMAPPRPE